MLLNLITTPQYGHLSFDGIGGNNSLLFTKTDLARGTSVLNLAYKVTRAVYRVVVAFIAGNGGGLTGPHVLLMVAGFGSTLESKRIAGALFFILGC